jgi:hypothetical protein
MPERPWLECNKGRALNQRGLAQLLKVFGLRTDKNVRRDQAQAKGFALNEFLEAFARYLPPLSNAAEDEHTRDQAPSQRHPSVPASQTNEINDLDPSHLPSQNNSDPSHTTGNGAGTESAAAWDGTRDGSNPAETLAWDGGTPGLENEDGPTRVRQGNGLDPDAEAALIADEIRDGYRCARCACAFTPKHGSELDAAGRYVHRGGCEPAQQAAAPAKPKRKRGRIKGADTTPDVDGLPS